MTLRGAGVVFVVVVVVVLIDVLVEIELEDDEPMLELESAARSVLAFPIPDAA